MHSVEPTRLDNRMSKAFAALQVCLIFELSCMLFALTDLFFPTYSLANECISKREILAKDMHMRHGRGF